MGNLTKVFESTAFVMLLKINFPLLFDVGLRKHPDIRGNYLLQQYSNTFVNFKIHIELSCSYFYDFLSTGYSAKQLVIEDAISGRI